MAPSTAAAVIFLSLLAQPVDAVTRAAVTRAALNHAGEMQHTAAASRPAASLVELAADASGAISSPLSHGISAHERAAMRRLTTKMAGGTRDASHETPPATIAAAQPAPATSDVPAHVANASTAKAVASIGSNDTLHVAVAAPEVAPAEASAPTAKDTEISASKVAPAAVSPQSAAGSVGNETSMVATSAQDEPVTEDVLSSIDEDLLAALANASSVLTNASQAPDLMNASDENASWAAWPGPLEPAGSDPSNSTELDGHAVDIGVPPSPFDTAVEGNATDDTLDGELGRLIGELHSHIDNGVVPAAVNAETKSAEYTRSLEELRDSIVGFKQGVANFEDKAKAKHRAVMRRVQQALDSQRSTPRALPNSTSGAIRVPSSTPAQ